MNSKWLHLRRCALIAALAFASTTLALAESDQSQRVKASYLVAFGREPNSGELSYWLGRTDCKTVADFVSQHRAYLMKDAGNHRAVIVRAYEDAMGRDPTEAEIAYWSKGNDPYEQLMANHLSWLQQNPAEYEKVIRRSYLKAFGRAVNSGELAYWKQQGTLSYIVLLGCHADWSAKNNATTKSESGSPRLSVSSNYLVTLPVSAGIAAETRTAVMLVSTNGGNVVGPAGGSIVAAGAGNIVAAGAGNIVAAGAGNVVAAGAGN